MASFWSFKQTHCATFSTTINAPAEAILKIIHDPQVFFALSPLIFRVSADPSKPSSYISDERLSFLGMFHFTISYSSTVNFHGSGTDTESLAGGGTSVKNKFRVKPRGDGATVLTEQSSVEGIFFLMPYIMHTIKQAHLENLSKVADMAEGTPNRQVRGARNVEHTISGPTLWSSPWFLVAVALPTMLYSWFTCPHRLPTIIALFGALSIVYCLRIPSDPYGLFHLSLNKIPGEDPETPPQTEWLNMGFWQNTDVFPDACRALASKLIQAAKYKSGDRVLDVGHGTGESLLLLLSNSSVRPSILTGITSLSPHHQRSQNRVSRLLATVDEPKPVVNLYCGDAICHLSTENHPLDPHIAQIFDVILALDCAYHFSPRRTFLRQSFDKLAPGGHIALADICFDPSALKSRRTWLTTSLLPMMPKQNLISTDGYVAEMRELGYVDVQLEDITKNVFPGFVRFLHRQGWGWWVFGTMIKQFSNAGARFVIISGRKAL